VPIPTDEYLSDLKPYSLDYLRSKARFNVLMWHRGARKTAALLNKRLPHVLTIKGLYWYIGPYLNQAIETVWKDPNTYIFRWIPEDLLKQCSVNKSDHSITFPNGSVWQLKGADKPNGLRGPKPVHIDVDEYGEIAKRWGSEFREAVLEPSIRSSGGGIDYAGTPKGNNDFTHILSLAKKDSDWWGSVKTVDDTGIYTHEQIEDIRKNAVNLDLFYQEYYCRAIEGASSVFKNVLSAVKGELEGPQRGEEYLFGIDLARSFDRTVIYGLKLSTNHIVFRESLYDKTWDTQKLIITNILWRYGNHGQPARAIVDATGMGDSFVEQLHRTTNAAGIPLRIEGLKIANNLIKRNLVEKLGTFIENGYITFPNIPELIDELSNFEYKITANNNVTYSAPSGKHDDEVMALALLVSKLSITPTINQNDPYSLSLNSRSGYLD
jgi:hypothetical protein